MEATHRSCGACHACCYAFIVPDLKKPKGHFCPHVVPGMGCAIYSERPSCCREFRCAWLDGHLGLPESYRPDHSGLILEVAGKMVKATIFEPAGVAVAELKSHCATVARRAFSEGFECVRYVRGHHSGTFTDLWKDGFSYRSVLEGGNLQNFILDLGLVKGDRDAVQEEIVRRLERTGAVSLVAIDTPK